MKALFTLILLISCLQSALSECTFWREDDCAQNSAKAMLAEIEKADIKQPLRVLDKDGSYEYTIGICKPIEGHGDAGIVQRIVSDNRTKVIGRISNTSAVAWDNWLLLDYRQGSEYHTKCNKEKRMARLIFACDETLEQPNVRVVDEVSDKNSNCYYLFEIQHKALCSGTYITNQHTSKLSPGSILCIIFLTLVAAYLMIGAAYQRFVAGAKGIDQIPHLEFWQDFGNLQADGCDFVCRRLGRTRSSPEYRGIDDHQQTPGYDSDGGRDDSLLPM